MKFIKYELYKLSGLRYIWIFILALLILNGFLSGIVAKRSSPDGVTNQEIADFYDLYFENQAEMNHYYTEMNSYFSEKVVDPDSDYGTTDVFPWVDKYAPEGYSDIQLFTLLHASIDSSVDYQKDIDLVIESAEKNLAELQSMGISNDSYMYKYQLEIIDIYSGLGDRVKIGLEHSYGWGDFFSYDVQNIFIFLSAALIAAAVMLHDGFTGVYPIIMTSRKGRSKTGITKIATAYIMTAAVVIIFTLFTFAVFYFRTGFSSVNNTIQSLYSFRYCQFNITIGQYFIISTFIRILTVWAFVSMIFVFSMFIHNYVLLYTASISFYGLNYFLFAFTYIDSNNVFKNLNIITTSNVSPLFERYRSFNFFSTPCAFVPAVAIYSVAMTLICAVIVFCVYKYNRLSPVRNKRLFFAKKSNARFNLNKVKMKIKHRNWNFGSNLISFELKKAFSSTGLLVIIVVLIFLRVFVVCNNSGDDSLTDKEYKDYMYSLQGIPTEEKRLTLDTERVYITNILNDYDNKKAEYINKEISIDEYRHYLKEHSYVNSKSDYLGVIEDHLIYLDNKSSTTGVQGWFLYDTGWKNIINTDTDYILLVLILILISGIFSNEYKSTSSSGGFSLILRTTVYGRKRTFFTKLCAAAIISAFLTVMFMIVDLVVISNNYSLPGASAPLASISQFKNIDSDITIYQYLIIMYLLRIISTITFTIWTMTLSQLFKKTLLTISVVVAMHLTPRLVTYFGVTIFQKVDPLSSFSGTQLIINSITDNLLGGDFIEALLFISVYMVSAFCFTVLAYRNYIGLVSKQNLNKKSMGLL